MEFDGGYWRDEAEQLAALPDVPAEWISGVGQLKYTDALPGWTDAERRVFQGDANAFLSTWAAPG
jgi:hypothetical protein